MNLHIFHSIPAFSCSSSSSVFRFTFCLFFDHLRTGQKNFPPCGLFFCLESIINEFIGPFSWRQSYANWKTSCFSKNCVFIMSGWLYFQKYMLHVFGFILFEDICIYVWIWFPVNNTTKTNYVYKLQKIKKINEKRKSRRNFIFKNVEMLEKFCLQRLMLKHFHRSTIPHHTIPYYTGCTHVLVFCESKWNWKRKNAQPHTHRITNYINGLNGRKRPSNKQKLKTKEERHEKKK